jgi:hypothetical protein
MRTNNETRRGCNLGRAPECVCSAADTRNTNVITTGGQSGSLRDPSSCTYLVCDYNAGLYLTHLNGNSAGHFAEGALRFATEQEACAFGEQYEEVFRRPYLIECWPAALEDEP